MSVIVPVRNRRRLLRELLDGLAAQTLGAHEVIVVDDGSSDGSGEEADADAARGRPVRLLRSGGAGAVEARRLGVAEARAPVLAFTDSDCVPVPGWLEAGVSAVEAGAAVVQGATRPARPARPLEHTVAVVAEDGLYATCNVFYRRSAFDAAGDFEPDAGSRLGFRATERLRGLGFGEDALLGWRVRRAGGRSAFVPEAEVAHHVFPPDLRDALQRAWLTGAFPALVAELPELRPYLLRGGVLLGGGWRLWLLGAAAAAGTGRPRLAALLGAGWAAHRGAALGGRVAGARRVPGALAGQLAVDTVTAAALAVGSARARRLVL